MVRHGFIYFCPWASRSVGFFFPASVWAGHRRLERLAGFSVASPGWRPGPAHPVRSSTGRIRAVSGLSVASPEDSSPGRCPQGGALGTPTAPHFSGGGPALFQATVRLVCGHPARWDQGAHRSAEHACLGWPQYCLSRLVSTEGLHLPPGGGAISQRPGGKLCMMAHASPSPSTAEPVFAPEGLLQVAVNSNSVCSPPAGLQPGRSHAGNLGRDRSAEFHDPVRQGDDLKPAASIAGP